MYSIERDKIASTVKSFLALVSCREMDVLQFAITAYGEHHLDFVDCVLYGYHCVKNTEIVTFDKKLLQLIAESSK